MKLTLWLSQRHSNNQEHSTINSLLLFIYRPIKLWRLLSQSVDVISTVIPLQAEDVCGSAWEPESRNFVIVIKEPR
jgi:hypothetical protein